MRVVFLVCHLTGTGHLVRTLALARAVEARGGDVVVISGGRRLAHVDPAGIALHQLPPLQVTGFDYATLRRPDGGVAPPAYLAERQRQIADRVAAFRPDALVTETFPLGRRRLAAEFERAIAAAQSDTCPPAIIASVRDIPEPPSRHERVGEAAARIRKHYDLVLVHGEAALAPLGRHWPLPDAAAGRVRYTGHIGPADRVAGVRGREVLVSVGGGALGERLLAIAVEAARHSDRPWRLRTGGPDAAERARVHGGEAPPNVTVEPPAADHLDRMARAGCSVSLAGYNTVMDLAACRTPAILVPFEEHGEREQAIRAASIADLPGIVVLRTAGLNARRLAAAVEAAATGPDRPPWPYPRDGAGRAADVILDAARSARQ